jgi:heme/copper-type cytochrome/quinol oxidase subunit 3
MKKKAIIILITSVLSILFVTPNTQAFITLPSIGEFTAPQSAYYDQNFYINVTMSGLFLPTCSAVYFIPA